MSETRVGIRELKARLSEYVRRVKAGRIVVIMEHGKPVARILPAQRPLEERIQAMVRAGLANWNGERLPATVPVAKVRGKRTVASLVVENRE